MKAETVSVVMAVRDEAAFIEEALDSVLSQTYEPIEVIVVDDGSVDRTAEIAEDRGVRVIRQGRRGVSAARNAGLAATSGEYWTPFDGDDVMPPDRLERQVTHLKARPELGGVMGLAEVFVTPGEPRPAHFHPNWLQTPCSPAMGTLLARRAVLDSVGGYNEALRHAEDVDWMLRAKQSGVRIEQFDEVVLRYRMHRANTSRNIPAGRSALAGVLREAIHRHRLRAAEDD